MLFRSVDLQISWKMSTRCEENFITISILTIIYAEKQEIGFQSFQSLGERVIFSEPLGLGLLMCSLPPRMIFDLILSEFK